MKYPAFNEYQAALQNPSRCLTPSGLKHCSVESDLWGLPRVRSGGFALTYKLTDGNSIWALRCFHKHVSDREDRYRSINQYIQKSNIEYLEKIHYVPDGICIKGGYYPITFMKWVEGETLESWVIRHLDQPQELEAMALKFYNLVYDLDKHKITHGDLSHHNIMVRDSKLILVDYDGMNVPEMKQQQSCEIGNSHFQHPMRDETIFDMTTDRFSSIVIYLALKTLSIDSRFWYNYETGGEGLLFSRSDFENPFQSALLQEMDTIASLNRDVRLFRQICLSDVHYVPKLEEFVNGLGLDLFIEAASSNTSESEKPLVLDAERKYLLNSRLGERLTVAGHIEEVFSGKTRDNVPHIFLNFGNWRYKCFTIVLWDEALSLMESAGIQAESFLDKWVCVTGMLTSYKRRPQMIVNTPFDIEILDEERVRNRIEASAPFKLPQYSKTVSKPIKKPIPKDDPVPTIQKSHPEPVTEEPLKLFVDPVVVNPLDISTEVVEKITDLYRESPDQVVHSEDNLELPSH